MRDFRRLLYKGVADPYEPCACDEDSRVKAIMQVVQARTDMQRELATLRVVTAKVNEHYTTNPSLSFVSAPVWMDEVWQLLTCLARMISSDTATSS